MKMAMKIFHTYPSFRSDGRQIWMERTRVLEFPKGVKVGTGKNLEASLDPFVHNLHGW